MGINHIENITAFFNSKYIRESYTHGSGFHLYCDLRLKNSLTNAENTNDQKKYVQIISAYANIISNKLKLYNGHLLEVQGERIHVFFEYKCDLVAIDKILKFANDVYSFLSKGLKAKAGDDWDGIAMAADYGDTIFIANEDDSSSVISLSPAANDPAKKLSIGASGERLVKSSHIWISDSLKKIKLHPYEDNQIKLKEEEQDSYSKKASAQDEFARVWSALPTYSVRNYVNSMQKTSSTFGLGEIALFEGYFFRADMDGFTAKVRKAFADNKVLELVTEFLETMNDSRKFLESISEFSRYSIKIPWAGDCFNSLICPQSEKEDNGHSMLIEIPYQWNCIMRKDNIKWVCATASSNNEDGSKRIPYLRYSIRTSNGDFFVISGWGAGRTNDAFLSNAGVDTMILHNADYQLLNDAEKVLFSSCSVMTMFKYAYHNTVATLKNKSLSRSSEVSIRDKNINIIAKPYYGNFTRSV